MAHVSHRLSNAFQGALAGGGDPATSPLYVFGPFLKLIVIAGVAEVTFGASIWLVVFTVVMVSAMYRLVMRWVVDGSGGSGLTEEEFGSWAVKVNAGITFVEYTLTFLVSIAALVTFIADRLPALNTTIAGVQYRTFLAVLISIGIGWLVNRGPKTAARAFGPATLAVLLLLWTMIAATIWQRGFHLPSFDLQAFTPNYLHFTLAGYARILALMTGIEIFANLVAAYDGTNAERSKKAFGSLIIIMGTTCLTMLIVGPAILAEADLSDTHVSVFTQTMDHLLPSPLPFVGTLIGVLVLASAAAASAQGIQNLALGLRYRRYIPAWLGSRNFFDVADKPVWVEVGIVALCYLVFGTHEETYLAIYAAGVFILLSMTGWAAAKRLFRELRVTFTPGGAATLVGTVLAALLTTAATVIIFEERFFEGAWTYLLFIPALYVVFSRFRDRLGTPKPLDEHLGRFFVGQYLLPFQRDDLPEGDFGIERIMVPLDGSALAEHALPVAELLARTVGGRIDLMSVRDPHDEGNGEPGAPRSATEAYLNRLAETLRQRGLTAGISMRSGNIPEEIGRHGIESHADVIVMATRGRSRVDRLLGRNIATAVVRQTELPVLVIRPTDVWTSRHTAFKKLLVSLDGSVDSEEVLPPARILARYFGSTVVLLAVPEAESEVPRLEHYLGSVAAALQAIGITVETRVTGSGASRTITSVAATEECDLIMMATRGRGAPEQIDVEVGSVTERVILSAHCPVFAVTVVGFGRKK
ncbi:MAG TPA: universal stress protein [Gemmatimonadales bacterium]|nr:universal stress protein [Gemmatimonadales bacterium]